MDAITRYALGSKFKDMDAKDFATLLAIIEVTPQPETAVEQLLGIYVPPTLQLFAKRYRDDDEVRQFVSLEPLQDKPVKYTYEVINIRYFTKEADALEYSKTGKRAYDGNNSNHTDRYPYIGVYWENKVDYTTIKDWTGYTEQSVQDWDVCHSLLVDKATEARNIVANYWVTKQRLEETQEFLADKPVAVHVVSDEE